MLCTKPSELHVTRILPAFHRISRKVRSLRLPVVAFRVFACSMERLSITYLHKQNTLRLTSRLKPHAMPVSTRGKAEKDMAKPNPKRMKVLSAKVISKEQQAR